jgi:glutathione S-transferase
MDLTLFYVPNSRALRARWMLEEVGAAYQLHRVDVKGGENRREDYLRDVQPLGHVPALRVDGRTMFESMAICLFLADAFPAAKLAPPIGDPARGEYLTWMTYSVTELEPPLTRWTWLARKEPRPDALVEEARAALSKAAAVIERRVSDRPFLLGEPFSAADLMVASVLGWAKLAGALDGGPALLEYSRRCTSREASRRARAD